MYSSPQFYMGAPSSQQQRGGLSAGMIALFIILAALLVAAGSGLTYYIIAIRPAQRQAQATANAQQTTTITATNPQDLYVQATSGTPALSDPLSPQNPNGWVAADGNCTFTGNALHASASPAGSKQTTSLCGVRFTSFDNFAYQARATIIQGDTSGLVFRIGAQGSYAFLIYSEGVYGLLLSQVNSLGQGSGKILAGASSSAINTGLNQPNLLTVIARGSTIYLYVNKQYLTSVSDSTLSVGAIGVWGENTQGGPADAAFSEIQVWKL